MFGLFVKGKPYKNFNDIHIDSFGVQRRRTIFLSENLVYRNVSFLYGGQFTLSILLINQIFVYHSPTDAAPQFL